MQSKQAIQTAVLLCVGVVATGCLTTRPSREPPAQALESKVRTSTFKEDTWTSDGQLIKKGTVVVRFDGYFADGERVDELTLFHLAGDEQRRDEILEYRNEYNTAVLAGWGGSALGLGLVAAGGVMFGVLGADNPEAFLASQQGQVAFGLMSGGGLVLASAPIAAVFMFMPKRSLHYESNGEGVNEEHVFSLMDADEAIKSFRERGTPGAETSDVTEATEPPTGG